MDDYSALAQRIAVSVNGVRGSLILSRDGLVLGAYPEGDEALAKPAWLKFVTLGEAERSFVEFGDQVWAFVKRGGYAAFSVAEAGTRPGILVDQMEQVLVAGEERRNRRDTVRLPDAASAPSGKPRTSLHPPAGKPQPSEVVSSVGPIEPQVAAVQPSAAEQPSTAPQPPDTVPPARSEPEGGTGAAGSTQRDPGADEVIGADGTAEQTVSSALKKEPHKLASSTASGSEDDGSEVDRVLLAKEFSGLLQMDSTDDEEGS